MEPRHRGRRGQLPYRHVVHVHHLHATSLDRRSKQHMPDVKQKVQRLQTAVRELLESLNAAEFEIYHQDPYDGGFKPRTIETFGLKKEDMQ